jgi:molybdate transport system ATP-binding protein
MGLSADFSVSVPIALRIRLHCAPGKMVALVGPSGAGKSTVMRALAGLIRAQGHVNVNGEQWAARPTHQRAVGLVSQQYNLLPHLTAAQNVAMGLSAADGEIGAQAKDWLKRVNLEGLGQRFPAQLSGGQQQRVALARALARKPQLLLLDEPFSSVDASTRQRLYEELIALRDSIQCPTVLVTHDVKEAALLADEIAVLAEGVIEAQGDAAAMLTQPPSARAARVLGWRNVIPRATWSAALGESAVNAHAGDYVLVAHRKVRITATGEGHTGVVESVLQLPHQAWARVRIGPAHVWGTVESPLRPGQASRVNIPDDAMRYVPTTLS